MPESTLDALIARLDLVDPTDPDSAAEHRTTRRLPALDGKVIALLDNRKGNANHLLARIGTELLAHGAAETPLWSKPIFSRPAPEPIVAEIAARCDAVVTAIGD